MITAKKAREITEQSATQDFKNFRNECDNAITSRAKDGRSNAMIALYGYSRESVKMMTKHLRDAGFLVRMTDNFLLIDW